MILWQALYTVFCVALAYVNYRVIAADKRVFHAVNGIAHLLFWVAAFKFSSWLILLLLPFIGRLFFDSALNLFRGLPLDYVPAKPKSIIDKVEKRFFGKDGETPKLIYLLVIIILNVSFLWLKLY
jgi:hypothetical protein